MDARLEKLRELNCDIDEALERFMGDTELYFVCFENLLGDDNLDKLGRALQAQDYDNAFHFAHKLKSVYANMGLTPIYNDCVMIVEPLRAGRTGPHLLESFGRMKSFMETIRVI